MTYFISRCITIAILLACVYSITFEAVTVK